MRNHPNTGLETAAEFGNAGLWADGTALLKLMADNAPDKTRIPPMTFYHLGQFAERLGDYAQAAEYRRLAAQVSPEYAFPFQWEAIHVLRRAMELNPRDARAPYYLGNLVFDWQPAEAVALWEKSASLDPSFPIVHRNLAVAYSHAPQNDRKRAIGELEKAVVLPKRYAMHFTELDELYAAAGALPEKRLALLEQNQSVVCTLEVADHWENAHVGRGLQRLAAGQVSAALADFQAARNIPENLPNDRRTGGPRTAEFALYLGLAQEKMGDAAKARQSWQEAVDAVPSAGGGRRGGGGETRALERQVQVYFQALARRKMGLDTEAETALRGILDAANRVIEQSGGGAGGLAAGRQAPNARLAMAHYVAGLGQLGLGDQTKARAEFEAALSAAPDLLGAKLQLAAMHGAE
jgi:tetratricopeptide (TPR) repeat protein